MFGGPLSTRAACEDTSVRAAILAAAEAERLKAAAAAARRAGSAGASSSKAHAPAPPPKPDPKEIKKKIIKNDLDAFDELNTDGPAKKKPAGPAGGAGDKGKAAAGAAAQAQGKPGSNGSRAAAAAAAGGKQRPAQTAAGLQQVRNSSRGGWGWEGCMGLSSGRGVHAVCHAWQLMQHAGEGPPARHVPMLLTYRLRRLNPIPYKPHPVHHTCACARPTAPLAQCVALLLATTFASFPMPAQL